MSIPGVEDCAPSQGERYGQIKILSRRTNFRSGSPGKTLKWNLVNTQTNGGAICQSINVVQHVIMKLAEAFLVAPISSYINVKIKGMFFARNARMGTLAQNVVAMILDGMMMRPILINKVKEYALCQRK